METKASLARFGRIAIVAFGLIAITAALACASDEEPGAGAEKSESFGNKAGFDSGLPTMRTAMKVVEVRERGPYLAAELTFSGSQMQAYVAPSEACREVFRVGEDVIYVDSGPLGVYRRARGEVSDARRRQPRVVGAIETRAPAHGVCRANRPATRCSHATTM